MDSTSRTSSRLDRLSTGRGSMEEVFSRMQSRRAAPSAVVLCAKDPPGSGQTPCYALTRSVEATMVMDRQFWASMVHCENCWVF